MKESVQQQLRVSKRIRTMAILSFVLLMGVLFIVLRTDLLVDQQIREQFLVYDPQVAYILNVSTIILTLILIPQAFRLPIRMPQSGIVAMMFHVFATYSFIVGCLIQSDIILLLVPISFLSLVAYCIFWHKHDQSSFLNSEEE